MQRFKNILLVVRRGKGRNASLGRAVTLAKRNQALLTVGAILEVPRKLGLTTAIHPEAFQKRLIQELREQLERLMAPANREGVQVTTKVLRGTPFLEIIREVLRNKHDLVMLTAEGKFKEIWFGSTATHLLRKCPCPVWVMKPIPRRRYTRIMAAVDPAPLDSVTNALNTKIMQLATSLAHLEQSELHIVHAWNPFAENILRYRPELLRMEVNKLIREVRKMHMQWLNELVDKFPVKTLKHQVHLLKGDTGTIISKLAKRKRIEVIVMGTVARTGVAGFFISNTAEKVLHLVSCAVLAVKPDEFVTPVRLDE